MLLNLPARVPCGIGGLRSDEADLLEGLARRAVHAEGNVVDVTGSAVGQHRDEVRVRPEARGHHARELAEVIGGHLRRRHPADVVERVVREERERTTARILNRENGHIGIGGAGGTVEHVGAGAGVHLHGVEQAVGIGRHLAGLEKPAAVEDLVGQRMRRRADRRRSHGRMRAHDGFRDAIENDLAISHGGNRAGLGIGGRRAVRVRGGDQHPFAGNLGALGGQLLRLLDDLR